MLYCKYWVSLYGLINCRGDKIIKIIECGSEILMGIFSSTNSAIVLTTVQKTLEVYSIENGQQISSM